MTQRRLTLHNFSHKQCDIRLAPRKSCHHTGGDIVDILPTGLSYSEPCDTRQPARCPTSLPARKIDGTVASFMLRSMNQSPTEAMDRAGVPKQFSICLYWTTTARKTKEKTVGDRNRPAGLILEWKMMMITIMISDYCI
jgi:hypothetical protein